MSEPTNDDWARAFAAAQQETGGDPFGQIDWDAFRLTPEQRRNGRSWHWTRRARILGWSLALAAGAAVGYFAYLLPWVRNP